MFLKVEDLKYKYDEAINEHALNGVSFSITNNDITAVIGKTGSGKSTLLQCIASILKYEGTVETDSEIRMVFQYPEYQLFESTVLKDVMFGAKNKGHSDEQAENLAKKYLLQVGITEDKFNVSPFELSGGEKRRVAIAGILVMEPQILLLDEPAAGLDPEGKKGMYALIEGINNTGTTIIFVTHSMDDVANYANNVLVLNEGKIILQGKTIDVFSQRGKLKEIGLDVPDGMKLLDLLKEKGCNIENTSILQFDEIKKCLETLL